MLLSSPRWAGVQAARGEGVGVGGERGGGFRLTHQKFVGRILVPVQHKTPVSRYLSVNSSICISELIIHLSHQAYIYVCTSLRVQRCKDINSWCVTHNVCCYVQEIAPNEASVWFQMGKIFKKLEQHSEALQHFNTALDLKPSSSDSNMIKSAIEKIKISDESDDEEI